jgi:hypothetical protein
VDVPGIAFDYASYSGYPFFTETNWIDNISLNGSTAPPPPPPTMLPLTKPITGMNFINTTPAAQYDRYQILDTNDSTGGLSFYGQSSVTYSWDIKEFPTTDAGGTYQAHFFIVSGPDSVGGTSIYPGPYDQAADYNLANCIFITVQSDGGIVTSNTNTMVLTTNVPCPILNFRYKTNEIGGNGMLFNTVSPTNTASNPNGWPIMPVCSLDDTNNGGLLGKWSVKFSGNTSVTITGPSGATTNFTLDAASAALFADPCSLLLGAQPNILGATNQSVIYSSFSLAGTPAAFTDTFTADAALNSNIWVDYGNDLNGAVLVPSGAAYWASWTLPASSFSLFVSTNLSSRKWQSLAAIPTFKNGTTQQALLMSNALPQNGTKDAFFAVISNSFSQLLVLLPGETLTPGASPGYSGTPTSVSLSANLGVELVTVYALDSNFNPVAGVTDSIGITSTTDGTASLPVAANMTNGIVSFNNNNPFVFDTAGPQTVTATDLTNTNIPAATSATVTVTP